jgi:3-methyladenine DNA glycosylase AlkD
MIAQRGCNGRPCTIMVPSIFIWKPTQLQCFFSCDYLRYALSCAQLLSARQMNDLSHIQLLLQQSACASGEGAARFFKTGEGHYAAHDRFMGVSVPVLRKIAKDFHHLSLSDLQSLMESPFNEMRLLALCIMVNQYQKADDAAQEMLYQFYMRNLLHVNNWNLVDASAHLILGAHLAKSDPSPLFALAVSDTMWERRVAIVATWHFIRQNELAHTFQVAEILLCDSHDLIHKATGWMLREAGKRSQPQLIQFLDSHGSTMPRTMLRYAIEKFPEAQRKDYLGRKSIV